MSKSRRWTKVWHELLTDANYNDQPLESQARWLNLLFYTSCHGDNGTIKIKEPARQLLHLLQCQNFTDLIEKISLIHGISVEKNVTEEGKKGEKNVEKRLQPLSQNSNAEFVVTFKNWNKYQI